MIDTGLEFVLSTHEQGRPKGRTISTTLIYYIIHGVVLLIFGGYTYYLFYAEKSDIDLGIGYIFNSLMFDYAYNLPIAIKETDGKHYVSFGISF